MLKDEIVFWGLMEGIYLSLIENIWMDEAASLNTIVIAKKSSLLDLIRPYGANSTTSIRFLRNSLGQLFISLISNDT